MSTFDKFQTVLERAPDVGTRELAMYEAARLRASIWQSIFTHDVRRYRRTMYRRMADFPTLITGPSGTGKELVARAIAASRYVAFRREPFGLRRRKQ